MTPASSSVFLFYFILYFMSNRASIEKYKRRQKRIQNDNSNKGAKLANYTKKDFNPKR